MQIKQFITITITTTTTTTTTTTITLISFYSFIKMSIILYNIYVFQFSARCLVVHLNRATIMSSY